MTHKAPYRPTHDVTQPFDDGLVEIFSVSDANEGTGLHPKEALTKIVKLPYRELKLGVQRYYAAAQNQVRIARVIRVPYARRYPISSQEVAITEDDQTYRIDLVQAAATFPPSLDLTLVKYEQNEVEEDDDYGEE